MKMKKMSGDTLVEVMFAVGIFSMVIISCVSVMNLGTKNIQQDLEIAMTRNEIDAQAEALRFIQSSYAAERMYSSDFSELGGGWRYDGLWNEIVSGALVASSDEELNEKLEYSPGKCTELYAKDDKNLPDGDIWKNKGFIINYRNLYQSATSDDFGNESQKLDASKIVYRPGSSDVSFHETTLYPRLLFRDNNDEEGDKYYSGSESNILKSADGLYVIAVKDQEGKYYDFYIRSCWQSSDEAIPTLTSTVIRLYDPCIDNKAEGCKTSF